MDANSGSPETQPRRRRRARRWIVRLVLLLIVVVVGAELFCRYQLGLGDPPLLQADPQIEYLYQPSKTYQRFGNTIAFNRWSMRSDDFPDPKDPHELRILLLGDSVINGGAPTDQRDLASEIIRQELPGRIGNRPVVVGNISAGSWGPANMLAYVKRFGLFKADIVIIVLSSHDWSDAPGFEELGVDFPTRKPWLAVEEAIKRYLPRYLPGAESPNAPHPPDPPSNDPTVQSSLTALHELIGLVEHTGARVAIAQHLEQGESLDAPRPGHDAIMNTAREAGAQVIQLGPSFEQARRAGGQPYRDRIHPNQLGQQIIAQTLMDWIVAKIRGSATSLPAQ
jgi:lysophospholipase L1-like esterase